MTTGENGHPGALSRRRFSAAGFGIVSGAFGFLQSSLAIPQITVDEFGIILRDSPLSVKVVEFSGPKAETITVNLVDGTTFGLKGIVESSTDPRSPLKVSASCRESGVKTKFVDLEALLTKTPKKKLYTNQRVQEAAAKEKAKEERIKQDEEDRLAAVAKMEQDAADTTSTKIE
ncbi:MAG: hypothetical protein SGBAC_008236 [Bacillariaceae sp.]